MRTYKDLAIAEEEQKLVDAVNKTNNLLVEAPTGSGKSLYIPWFLSNHFSGRIVVLQPRRIAALALAQYSAKLHNEPCGKTIGYQFRQDSCKSSATRILFQTYGNFLQELLHGKMNAEWVIFDEYHERKADMDLLFAYLLKLQAANRTSNSESTKAPRIAVMSAKLNREEMEQALGVKCLELGHPLYPVQVLHQKPAAGTNISAGQGIESEVVRALRTLYRNNVWQTTLVFLPGKAEIAKCHTAASEALGDNVAEFLELYGGQDRETQDRIFEETERPRVIFTTNIAETSITVPNVTGVVDSGIERVSEYDDSEKVNVLRTLPISLQNAIQRSGRSGRTQNGCAIRLWTEDAEKHMPQGIVPEVLQFEPSEFLLQKAALEDSWALSPNGSRVTIDDDVIAKQSQIKLPTAIPEARERVANAMLNNFGMLQDGRITELGKLMQTIYEDRVLGKMPEKVCANLLEKYQQEHDELNAELSELLKRADVRKQDENDVDEFIRRLKSYAGAEQLTRQMCLDLIEYVTVDAYPGGRKLPRDIHIYYKLIDKPLTDRKNALA